MDNFPSNSQMPRLVPDDKPEEKRILKVVEGEVTRRKKPLGTRMREMFLTTNDQSVFEYVLMDVLVPALKDMMSDAVSTSVERVLFGGQASRTPRRRTGTNSGAFGNNNVNYNRYSSTQRREDRPAMSRRARGSHDFDEIIIGSRSEAQDVIDQLLMLVSKYDAVSVRDLYEIVGVEFHHTDEKWGWTNLDDAGIRRISSGYLLILPKTEPLD